MLTSLILFILCWVFAVFFLVGFIVLTLEDAQFENLLLLALVGILIVFSSLVTKNSEYETLKNPNIVYNPNGAIIAYGSKNYPFEGFSEVEGLKNGTMVPTIQKDYNFYGYEVVTKVVLKPLDK